MDRRVASRNLRVWEKRSFRSRETDKWVVTLALKNVPGESPHGGWRRDPYGLLSQDFQPNPGDCEPRIVSPGWRRVISSEALANEENMTYR